MKLYDYALFSKYNYRFDQISLEIGHTDAHWKKNVTYSSTNQTTRQFRNDTVIVSGWQAVLTAQIHLHVYNTHPNKKQENSKIIVSYKSRTYWLVYVVAYCQINCPHGHGTLRQPRLPFGIHIYQKLNLFLTISPKHTR